MRSGVRAGVRETLLYVEVPGGAGALSGQIEQPHATAKTMSIINT